MTDLSAPTPYTDTIEPSETRPFWLYQSDTSYPAINEGTYKMELLLDKVFSEDGTMLDDGEHTFGKPVRMEFFMEDRGSKRGMVLFDDDQHIIIHSVDALLGYGGSGGQLSGKIMKRLGVPAQMFEQIQARTKGPGPYFVIVSREPEYRPAPRPGPPSEWQWWFIERKPNLEGR